ncbi:hypothetical protein Bphyt_6199 [Paraburkholderia phytofirmans PsJN]|uniref:Uncharacterized protein n=1 Tax=Paraburkholderia phytofirmans (strain DSM 17436 / LMG 22146 / PsJN) TaxID=398527 RepID=B2T8G2_PARPJ|nr:hypothetical protein Bphyt_6199 [Paraburkholderia phytofirmans PsJN]
MRCMILGAAFPPINKLEFQTYRTPMSAIMGTRVDGLNALKGFSPLLSRAVSRIAGYSSSTRSEAGRAVNLPPMR